MKAHTLLTKAAAGLGAAALVFAMSACSHNSATAGQDYGNVRTEQAAQQQATTDQTIAAAPAPANTQGTTGGTQTPAIISGPAKVDNSGRLYTSSSVGSAGNASATGLNTDVNIIPKTQPSTVTVTTSPAPVVTTETTTVETAPAPVVETTPAPAPAPPVLETPAPMTSSTTTTQTTHRRLRKD